MTGKTIDEKEMYKTDTDKSNTAASEHDKPFINLEEKNIEKESREPEIVKKTALDNKNGPCENNGGKKNTVYQKPLIREKARMIFDKEHFCVSYFADAKEYSIKDPQGMDKTPIYISFAEKKPIIGKAAMKMYDEKPGSVVFDLIKLCSISSTDVESPKWGFSY